MVPSLLAELSMGVQLPTLPLPLSLSLSLSLKRAYSAEREWKLGHTGDPPGGFP